MVRRPDALVPLIAIDRSAPEPLHTQIYRSLRTAVARGDLRAHQRLPSSRTLSVELGVSRITVLDAYSQMLAEGYFESRAGSGTYVCSALPEAMLNARRPQSPRARQKNVAPRGVARRAAQFPIEVRTPWQGGLGAFAVHQPAFEQFPFAIWARLIADHSRNPNAHAIHHVDPLGSKRLREAICTYLRTSRAVQCDPEQIMVVSGSQQALQIATTVLLDPGDPIWMEEPGYRLARNLFTASGCRVIPVPVDNEGLQVEYGIRQAPGARVAYVSPSHQYPLGSTMSASRRMQLLDWAQRNASWIIEDDYDSEYRFESPPVASLQGLDSNGRVIYIGTFSKVLFPSLRLGYVVIPPDLVERFIAVRYTLDIFPPYLFQEVIADFMREGHFSRHIRRMRLLYTERRAALVRLIEEQIPEFLQVSGTQAGMHLAAELPSHFDDTALARRAAEQHLWLWPLSTSYATSRVKSGFILGYGNVDVAAMGPAITKLRSVLQTA